MKTSRMATRALGISAVLVVLLAGSTVRGVADYAVRTDDKLKIKIFQYPELSGEYTVSANGTITIAPIGEIPVDGSSTKDVASQISERFIRAGLSDKPGTTVDIIQSRPIYIMGDVQKPGEYPYRPGVTVLQAVSLAGGWMRFNDPGMMRLERESITIRGDMRGLVRRYYHLIAQRARLSSELAMKTDIAFPAELMHRSKDDNSLAEALEEERSFLNIHVDVLRNQLDSLQQTRSLYEREIEAVSLQIQANKVQHEAVQKELDQVKEMFARGLTTLPRKLELERTLAQFDVAEQGFQTLILRARQSITQVDQKMFDLKSERNASLSSELQRTRLELDDIGVKFDTSRNLLVEAQLTAPNLVSTVADGIVGTRSLVVVRVQDGKPVTLDAEEHMELLPGDVLKVERAAMPSGIGMDRIPVRNLFTPTAGKN
jgi:polysaccharide biosynthesis/export protein ExoF